MPGFHRPRPAPKLRKIAQRRPIPTGSDQPAPASSEGRCRNKSTWTPPAHPVPKSPISARPQLGTCAESGYNPAGGSRSNNPTESFGQRGLGCVRNFRTPTAPHANPILRGRAPQNQPAQQQRPIPTGPAQPTPASSSGRSRREGARIPPAPPSPKTAQNRPAPTNPHRFRPARTSL